MKDSECYSFKLIHETDNPYLKNVDISVVLTMENSSRTFDDPVLLNLARYTYLQINKGYKKCNKPGVNNPTQDVKHAFKNVMRNTSRYNNIIIFEDDAEFNDKYSIDEFKNIDDFLKTEHFDTYSLGSLSLNVPGLSDHKRILSKMGACHAVIYSITTRLNFIYIDGYQVDTDIISSFQNNYKYKYPLVCQTFPETPAKKEWGNNIENLALIKFMDITGADKHIEPFWSSIYFICDYLIFIIIIIILVIIKCYM